MVRRRVFYYLELRIELIPEGRILYFSAISFTLSPVSALIPFAESMLIPSLPDKLWSADNCPIVFLPIPFFSSSLLDVFFNKDFGESAGLLEVVSCLVFTHDSSVQSRHDFSSPLLSAMHIFAVSTAATSKSLVFSGFNVVTEYLKSSRSFIIFEKGGVSFTRRKKRKSVNINALINSFLSLMRDSVFLRK